MRRFQRLAVTEEGRAEEEKRRKVHLLVYRTTVPFVVKTDARGNTNTYCMHRACSFRRGLCTEWGAGRRWKLNKHRSVTVREEELPSNREKKAGAGEMKGSIIGRFVTGGAYRTWEREEEDEETVRSCLGTDETALRLGDCGRMGGRRQTRDEVLIQLGYAFKEEELTANRFIWVYELWHLKWLPQFHRSRD